MKQYKEAEVTREFMQTIQLRLEHPQHIEEMDKLVCAMADAQDKLDIVKKVYPDKEFLAE